MIYTQPKSNTPLHATGASLRKNAERERERVSKLQMSLKGSVTAVSSSGEAIGQCCIGGSCHPKGFRVEGLG